MSTRAAIMNMIPFSWDIVLRKHRKLTRFVEYMYNDCVPIKMRNKYHYRAAIRICRLRIQERRILDCFDAIHSKEGLAYWENIQYEINQLEESWK